MRNVREQPRLVLARILGAICLVLAGVAIGSALDRGDADRMHATELRLASAQRTLTGGRAELRAANARVARAEATVRRTGAQARALARSNRRLRDELATAERKHRTTKSNAHK